MSLNRNFRPYARMSTSWRNHHVVRRRSSPDSQLCFSSEHELFFSTVVSFWNVIKYCIWQIHATSPFLVNCKWSVLNTLSWAGIVILLIQSTIWLSYSTLFLVKKSLNFMRDLSGWGVHIGEGSTWAIVQKLSDVVVDGLLKGKVWNFERNER